MKRPKVRIGTLMLLIIVVALSAALFIERRQHAQAVAALQAAEARSRAEMMQRQIYMVQLRTAQAQLVSQTQRLEAKGPSEQPPQGR